MESGPLEGPGEAHGSVLPNDVGEGLLAFRAFPCLHGSVGPRIHTLNPRQTSEEGAMAGWLPSRGPSHLARPTFNREVPSGQSGPLPCEITLSRGVNYVDAPVGPRRPTLPEALPGDPMASKERKTYHHEVELTVHRADGLEDKRDPGHLFVLRVRHHRLWRSVGQELKVSSEAGGCLLQSSDSSRPAEGCDGGRRD